MGVGVAVGAQLGSDHATAIETAFLDNHEMVYKAAFRVTGNASDAEDVLQTLFLRLIRREWVPDIQLGWPAYLHRAAINIAIDMIRTRAREVQLGDAESVLPEKRPDPHCLHSAAELRDWLRAAVAELNPRAAEIFILRHVEGYKLHEIAGMLNTTRSTVAVTLFRTRSRLRKSLRTSWGGI